MRVFLVFLVVGFVAGSPAARGEPPAHKPAVTYAVAIGREPAGDIGLRTRKCDAACLRALVLPLAPPAAPVRPVTAAVKP